MAGQQALAGQRAGTGSDHTDTIDTMRAYAGFLVEAMGNTEEAEPLYAEAYERAGK